MDDNNPPDEPPWPTGEPWDDDLQAARDWQPPAELGQGTRSPWDHCLTCGADLTAMGHLDWCDRDTRERHATAGHPDNRLRPYLHYGLTITKLPPLEPLVDGLLYLPGESVLFAPPNIAKTFWALDLALSVAVGQPFMGRQTRQGNVLFVAAEGVGGMGARVDAWCQHHQANDIHRACFLATAVNLLDRHALTDLTDILDEHQPILTIFDTLARCMVGADENSSQDMGRTVEALDTVRNHTQGHIGNVHHAGKDTAKGMRGSSALLGAVDTVIELSGDSRSIHCKVTKQKDAEPPDPWWCQLTPAGSSAVIVESSGSDVTIANQNRVLALLEQLPDEDRTSSKWQALAEDANISRATFYRAKQALIARGWVHGGGQRGALYTINEGDPDA
jgi:hypothetical protein